MISICSFHFSAIQPKKLSKQKIILQYQSNVAIIIYLSNKGFNHKAHELELCPSVPFVLSSSIMTSFTSTFTILCWFALKAYDSYNILPSPTTVNLAEPWIFARSLNFKVYEMGYSVLTECPLNYNVNVRTISAKFTFICQYP